MKYGNNGFTNFTKNTNAGVNNKGDKKNKDSYNNNMYDDFNDLLYDDVKHIFENENEAVTIGIFI